MSHERFMEQAISLARRGVAEGEAPVGALVELDGEVVAEAYWQGGQEGRSLPHPELTVLLEADRLVKGLRRRATATLYTTVEPCVMCMGAAMCFFIGRVVYALAAPRDGAADLAEQWTPHAGHPPPGQGAWGYLIPQVIGGVGRDDAAALLGTYLRGGPTGPLADWAATLVPEPRSR